MLPKETIVVVPATIGWKILFPVYEEYPSKKINGIWTNDVIAWSITHHTPSIEGASTVYDSEPISVEGGISASRIWALQTPSGEIIIPDDPTFTTSEELIAYWNNLVSKQAR